MLDQITINKFIAGDVKAFECLFRKYARGLQLVALGLYQDITVAEDAVQESFMYLWNHREEMAPDMAIDSYLCSSVRHYVLNYIRHQNIRIKREKEIVREQEWLARLTYDETDIDAKLLIIKNVIDTLPEGCRKIFVMSVIEGMSYIDTAKELGVSVNTVKTQVKIAYKKLKNTVQKSPDNMYLTILFLLSLKKIL